MRKLLPLVLLACGVVTMPASAQSFSFYSTIRAGLPGGGDWEIGLGSTSSASTANSHFAYNPGNGNHWNVNGPQTFQIGFDAALNQGYATVWNINGTPTTVTFANLGGAIPANSIWTLPGNSFFVSAANRPQPSAILLQNLTLSPNTVVVSGSLPAELTASQPGGGPASYNSLGTNLVIDPASNGGSWFISGTVQFQGLTSQGGSAQRSQLQFNLLATSSPSSVPEPSTYYSIGAGLAVIAFCRKRFLARGLKA
jgi:hypothetical protein